MLTVQYNGPERVINQTVWLPGETREATPKQLAAWQAEQGDMFVVVSGALPAAESDAAVEPEDPGAEHEDAVQGKGRRK